MSKQYVRTKNKTHKSVPMSAIKAKENDNLVFTISTATPDRDEDILEPKGAQLKNYKKNSVVLFAHDYHSLPIGKSVSVKALDDHIEAEVEFAPTQFAQEVRVLCEQGFLNAASVGFIPIDMEPIEQGSNDTEGMIRQRGFRFKKWDLLEWSIVPVPSNFEALIQNAKSKGFEVNALEEELVKEEPLPEVDITKFEDPERVLLDPNTGEKRTEPFEDILTIEDSEAFKEVHISGKMAEKLVVDGEPYAEKAGRILSAANEKRIKNSRDSLTEVLNQLEDQAEDDDKSVKDDFVTLNEAIERLEIFAGMLAAKNTTVETDKQYLEIDMPDTPVIMIDDEGVKDFTKTLKEEIKSELAKERTRMTGRID